MDSDISHKFNCVYYDSELDVLRKNFTDCKKILDRIDKRARRASTMQVSKSLFDYVEKKRLLDSCPSEFYCFVCGDVKIQIVRYLSRYHVSVCGFKFDKIAEYYCESRIDYTDLYGDFDSYKECIPLFFDIVCYYLYNVRKVDELSF